MSNVNKGIGIHARTHGGGGAEGGRPSLSTNTAAAQAVSLVNHHHHHQHQPQEHQHSDSSLQQTQSVSGSQDQGAKESSSSSSSPSIVGESSHCHFADEDVAVFECQASIPYIIAVVTPRIPTEATAGVVVTILIYRQRFVSCANKCLLCFPGQRRNDDERMLQQK